MLLTVVVSSRHASIPTPARCCHCGRTKSFVPGATEMLTSEGWHSICTHCEAALDLPGLKLHTPRSELYSLAEWIISN